MALAVPAEKLEEARARLLELHPEGFEEANGELAVYTDPEGEARLREVFSEVSTRPVEPGWEERWREFHRPVWIGPLWVGSPWEELPASAIAVVVDPGRAFGTGSHPTTRLCLDFLVSLEPGSLVDVGCGSGVLSIAAAKLGFAPVTAIDVGTLVTSGYFHSRRPRPAGYAHRERRIDGGWAADLFVRE